jgi:hypothetical protein
VPSRTQLQARVWRGNNLKQQIVPNHQIHLRGLGRSIVNEPDIGNRRHWLAAAAQKLQHLRQFEPGGIRVDHDR